MKSVLEISKLLKDANIKHWIDQGTLLAIVRDKKLKDKYYYENKFIPLDDIDISIDSIDLEKLEDLCPIILNKGYQLRRCYYKNKLFQYKFIPLEPKKLRIIDCKVYYKSIDSCYWSVKKRIRVSKIKVINTYYNFIINNWFKDNRNVHIDKFPLSVAINPFTWILPIKFIDDIVFSNEHNIFLPSDYNNYLKYHFGNWKVPIQDWTPHRDDGAIRKFPPDKVKEVTDFS